MVGLEASAHPTRIPAVPILSATSRTLPNFHRQEMRTMRRTTRIGIGAFVVLAASTAVVAQQPSSGGTPGSEYFPLKQGNKWVYKVGDTTTIEMKVEKIDAGEATLNTYVNGKQVASEAVKVAADGVTRTKINNTPINPPVKFLALPVKKGAEWPVDSKITV